MKIGFVTKEDLCDKKAWSGIIYQMYMELSRRYGAGNIMHIKTYDDTWARIYFFILRIIARICNRSVTEMDFFLSKRRASVIKKQLKSSSVDILFAPAGCVDIGCLNVNIPILYFSDATFKLLYKYYPQKRLLFRKKEFEAFRLEKKAMQNSSFLMFASHWAMRSANYDYNIDKKKTDVLEFGANVIVDKTVMSHEVPDLYSDLKLLFIGVDWFRKGGGDSSAVRKISTR